MPFPIRRIVVFALLLHLLAGSGLLTPPPVSASSDLPRTVLVEDDFSQALPGTGAAAWNYDFGAPATGTGGAVIAAIPEGAGNAMRLSLQDGTSNSFSALSKTFDSQTGAVIFETSFMSATGTQPYLNLIGRDATNSADLFAARISSSKGKLAFFSTKNGPAESAVIFAPGIWYNLKVEANVQTQKVSVWVDDVLVFSRIGIADSVRSIYKLQWTTTPNNGEVYIRHVRVKATPPTTEPPAPTGLYYIPRNEEIAIFWDAGVTHATQHNIKIKENPDDPWTVFVYNKTNFLPTERTSVKKVNGANIVNGTSYFVGVSNVLKDLDGKLYEGPTTVIEATPNDVISVPSAATSIISGLQVYDAYYGSKWAVKAGLKLQEAPFSEREYRVTALPARFERMEWIQPNGNSQRYAEKPQLAVFTARDAADVYVAMDARATVPAWLEPESGWAPTGETIQVADATYPYTMRVYRKEVAANSAVTLGLNTTAEVTEGRNIGYFVLAERKSTGLQLDALPQWTSRSQLSVSGTVYESPVTLTVTNNGQPVFGGLVEDKQFQLEVPLAVGKNTLVLSASRPGTTLTDQVTSVVYYDPEAPQLMLVTPPSEVKSPGYSLQGTVDETSVISVTNNGSLIIDKAPVSPGVSFDLPLTLDDGSNRVVVTASDLAGNETIRELAIHYTFWAGAPEFYDMNGSRLQTLVPSTPIVAAKQITNTTSQAKQIALFVALYDSKQRMIDVSNLAATFAPGETKTLRTGFVLPERVNGYKLKAYVWDGLNSMKPLSEESVLP